jgi:hypothetical protein
MIRSYSAKLCEGAVNAADASQATAVLLERLLPLLLWCCCYCQHHHIALSLPTTATAATAATEADILTCTTAAMPLPLQGDRRCGHAEAKDLGFSAFKFQTTYGKQALRSMLNFLFLSQDCKDIVLPTLEGDAPLHACALQCMHMCLYIDTYTCI